MGNPGERYRDTRHNLGYRVVESFSRLSGAGKTFQLRRSCCAGVFERPRRVLLARPRTFMNLSGAVAELMRRYHLGPGQLIVVYDDLDLPPGRLRLRSGGSSGGHRGVQSIIDTIGTADFLRLRIGIGRPPDGDPSFYVLEVPPSHEKELLEASVDRAAEALGVLLEKGLDEAMNRFNRSP